MNNKNDTDSYILLLSQIFMIIFSLFNLNTKQYKKAALKLTIKFWTAFFDAYFIKSSMFTALPVCGLFGSTLNALRLAAISLASLEPLFNTILTALGIA